MKPDYPTLFFFELGQWYDYLMLVVVIAALAVMAWLAIRYKWVAIAVFIVIPVALTIFWWPTSRAGTNSDGWFPIVKQTVLSANRLPITGSVAIFPQATH